MFDYRNLIPAERISLRSDHRDPLRCLGCRHGLVLLFSLKRLEFLVWDPLTGDRHHLAIAPGVLLGKTLISGFVLRAAGDGHHFLWKCMSENIATCVMRAEGGGIGFLLLLDFNAQLWKRKTDRHGIASCEFGRTCELDKPPSLKFDKIGHPHILGFASQNNVVFPWTLVGVFMLQLESLKFKTILETSTSCCYYPYESVYNALAKSLYQFIMRISYSKATNTKICSFFV
ncbi:hypothetical protein BRADI_1g30991v3 [Brachypodium distachyon]|uniref:Uncharacterized protein n=1 Tax=Brachypodium distachyon TaxID=15368 RepID=A0A0Q3NHE3_BRADI|nr:hypothetical protein BRADI_1g30991v3 [Brachypodium distachyon]